VPIFIDSLGNFILLNWWFLYNGTIRDFYPVVNRLEKSRFQVYIESLKSKEEIINGINSIGKKVLPEQFSEIFDFAFLILHGLGGEDGQIQGLLNWYNIPYSGTGILGSAIGIDKLIQRKLMKMANLATSNYFIIKKADWLTGLNRTSLLKSIIYKVGLPFVIKPILQGSSIGVSVIYDNNIDDFIKAVNKGFFIKEITSDFWQSLNNDEKIQFVKSLIDVRYSIGFPIFVGPEIMYHPNDLIDYLDSNMHGNMTIQLQNLHCEENVLIESYIHGREFSCVVLQNINGEIIALPPTEMIKPIDTYFDYREKYLPGAIHKETPMQIEYYKLDKIRESCTKLFDLLNFQTYARIDGFIKSDGSIYLNDPNTTVGMTPSSFIFHQAAEVGMSPKSLITFIIENSSNKKNSFFGKIH